MSVDVDVHDTSGASLSRTPAWPAALHTNVYASQDAGVEPLIRRIVDENLGQSAAPPPPRTAQAAP
jgi:hypothetical protein